MNANLTTAPAQTVTAELTDGKSPCNCSDNCPGLTTRFFSQGHDARLVTRLRNAVQAGEMPIAEAFAEITKRGGTERLQIKLDAAVANARKPRKAKAAKKAKAAPLVTFQLDEFVLREDAHATETGVWARVGRWSYQGDVTWHRIVEEGATAADTVGVFRYESRDGEPRKTLRFTQIAAPADQKPAELPIANRVATPEAAEARADESLPHSSDDFADIPF